MLSHHFPLTAVILAWAAATLHETAAAGPDRVILKNGRALDGLIVRGDAETITLRQEGTSRAIPRSSIRRIDDTATTGAYFAASSQMLPPWEAIVNDLRTNEGIHDLRLIASGRETSGAFTGTPFVVFEMNGAIELRIYGDPANPAGLQLGLRAARAGDRAERQALRSFLAGFLTRREQIAALYALEMEGGEKSAGEMSLAYGTQRRDAARAQWWVAVWNPAAMRAAREHAIVEIASAHGWENGFRRDRDGNMRTASATRAVALGY